MGRFLLFFSITWLGLATFIGITAALASYAFHFDLRAWTQITHWYSVPVVVAVLITALSGVVAATASLLWSLLLKAVSGVSSKPRSKARPQSRRRTTV